jgi:hypothetical protein
MAKTARTKHATAAQARQYLAKAEEFLVVAAECLQASRHIAATGNAIHATMNAADAVCVSRIGQRSAGQDHAQAIDLLKLAGPDGAELARHLARLLPLKTKAEYDPDDVPRGVASRAVGTAQKAVAVARRVVAT